MTHTNTNNIMIDGALAVGALTLPWWAQMIGEWTAFFVTIGTFILIILRLIIAYREIRKG